MKVKQGAAALSKANTGAAAPGPGSVDASGTELEEFNDFDEEDYLRDLLKECAKDKAVAVFSCDAKYAEMCQMAIGNLEAMGIGHIAIATDEDVCDTLGYDDYCCTVAEDVIGEDHVGPSDAMYTVRWQYLEIAY